MNDAAMKAMENAVSDLRHTAGGSNPWTESLGTARCSGGFAWRDNAGNQFDLTISLVRQAPEAAVQQSAASLRHTWQTIILGDDAVYSTDPDGWRFARACAAREMEIGSGEKW